MKSNICGINDEIYTDAYERVKKNIEIFKVFEKERLLNEIRWVFKKYDVDDPQGFLKNEVYSQIKSDL